MARLSPASQPISEKGEDLNESIVLTLGGGQRVNERSVLGKYMVGLTL